MAVLDVRFDIFLVRFDISRPIRHSVLPKMSTLGTDKMGLTSSKTCQIFFINSIYRNIHFCA